MSSQTPNLNLVLPVGTERVSRQIINENNTKIDTAVGANADAINANSSAITKWASRHSASDIGNITSLSSLQSTLKTLADALALYETKYFFVTIAFSGTFEYYNTVYTGEISYITPDRYNVLMQNHTNASQIYRGACSSGTWSWDRLATKSDISHEMFLCTAGSNFALISNFIKKSNNIVYASGFVVTKGAISKNDVILSLPSGYTTSVTVTFTRNYGNNAFVGAASNSRDIIVDQTPSTATANNQYFAFNFVAILN